MRAQSGIIATVLFFLFAGCGDEKPLRGWKSSDVEVINEGTASGSSSHVVAPGENFEPMTSTDVDTTTVSDIVGTGTLDEGEFVDEGSLASTLELDEEGQPVSGSPPESRSRRPSPPPQPSTRPAPTETEREPRRSPEPANDPVPAERSDPNAEPPIEREEPVEPEPDEDPPSEEPDESPPNEDDPPGGLVS